MLLPGHRVDLDESQAPVAGQRVDLGRVAAGRKRDEERGVRARRVGPAECAHKRGYALYLGAASPFRVRGDQVPVAVEEQELRIGKRALKAERPESGPGRADEDRLRAGAGYDKSRDHHEVPCADKGPGGYVDKLGARAASAFIVD